jgi:hypothetical protein
VAFVSLEPGMPQRMALDHALHQLQHWRDQFRLRGQQQTQQHRQRHHPLSHRHMRDDVVQPKAGSWSWPHSPQCSRRKPGARMPHSRKASNPSSMKRGRSAPVLASVWAMKLAVGCRTRQYRAVCSGRRLELPICCAVDPRID